jgi:uncharacterized phage protein (TIGR01671 family)
MRTIKFRGKCAISGDWVYGDLIHGVGHKDGNLYILPNRVNLAYVKHCDPLDGVRVAPESVGQFVGLHDRNGKEIYDGDVARDLNTVFKIIWFKGRFDFERISGAFQYPYFGDNCNRMEVIGNIYENPELLTQPS